MSNWKLYAGVAAATMATAAIIAPAQAQVTSSSINGQVVDSSGSPVAGANVTIINTRTGAAKTATTSANGVFRSSGLQVGGPFTVSVQSEAGSTSRDDVFLKPSANSLTLTIAETDRTLDTVVVMGQVVPTQDTNNGVGSVFTNSDILNQPSVERDLIATLARDPLASSDGPGSIGIAGTNPRFNGFAIDGARQTNDFGLNNADGNASTYATERSPISLDVIESASIVASDYSVKSAGFTGGLVNVITKSGSNEFDGAVYYYRQDEDYFGGLSNGTPVETAPFTEEEYGFVLSGPIVKDKLFFLVSYDEFESGSSPNFSIGDAEDGVNAETFERLNQFVLDTYGYDMGGRPTSVSNPITSERFLGKLDWNINENHRASFTYQSTEEGQVDTGGNTTFSSSYYSSPSELTAYTAQLFSDWTPEFSTEFRINYKEFSRAQLCNAGDSVGAFDIQLRPSQLVGTVLEGILSDPDGTDERITFAGGCDRFRQGNTFDDERLQIFGAGNYVLGDHFITFGADLQQYELDNFFAQRSVGEFRYRSFDDLSTRTADRVRVQLPASGNREDTRVVWGYDQLALFAQDEWQITPDFRLDYGIRYENYISFDSPPTRAFHDALFPNNPSNTGLDGKDIWMPRVGFEYTPFERTRVTGGFGLFAGGDPAVWTSNAFSSTLLSNLSDVADTNPSLGTPAASLADLQSRTTGPIDVIDPDFEIPSDWRASLKVDQEFDLDLSRYGLVDLGDDYLVSFQLLASQVNNGFLWRNLAHTDLAGTQPTGIAPDGRPIYADLETLGINNHVQLTNYDEGESLTYSIALSKEYDNGIGFFASYANQDIEDVTGGSSSRGISLYRGLIVQDRNNVQPGISPFQTEHSFKLNLSYEDEIFGDLTSRFNLFGTIDSGSPFSYTFNSGFSRDHLFGRPGDGEGQFDNDLLYVPTLAADGSSADANVVFASTFNTAAFADFVNERGLSQGQIQARNSDESNWSQRWDFQYQQELPFFNDYAAKYVGENSLKFVVDIQNVANLLNDEWGTQFNGPGFGVSDNVTADLVSAADVAANGVDGATALRGDAPRTTCVSQGDCLYRYRFFSDRDTSRPDFNDSVYEIRVGLRFEF